MLVEGGSRGKGDREQDAARKKASPLLLFPHPVPVAPATLALLTLAVL